MLRQLPQFIADYCYRVASFRACKRVRRVMLERKYIRCLSAIVTGFVLVGCSITTPRTPLAERLQVLPIKMTKSGAKAESLEASNTLRLVTLNLAHGRHDSFHQLLLSAKTIQHNIDETAAYIKNLEADVVALQEADGPSRWSGNFDHVARLAEQAEQAYYIRGENVNNWLGDYGSAVLSQHPIKEGLGFVFQPSPPTSNKGFSLAQIHWLNADSGETKIIDVVSVHLDFSRDSVRQEQIDEIKAILAPRLSAVSNSLIIMGDFNSEWLAREYMVEAFAENSALHVFDADNELLNTYGKKRLDWILMSKDLEFIRYRVDDAKLSDHRVVIADIKLKD